MAKKQMEIENIDNTPLAKALSRCADIKQQIIDSEKELEEASGTVLEEMKNIGKDEITSNGFRFKINKKSESEKLSIKKINE